MRRSDSNYVDAVQYGPDLPGSCRVLRINGVFRRMLMPEEAEAARKRAEKMNKVLLMRW